LRFAIAVDGSWGNVRNANQGSYTLEIWHNRKILYQIILEKSIYVHKGEEKIILKQG